jgi:hypothetical protein
MAWAAPRLTKPSLRMTARLGSMSWIAFSTACTSGLARFAPISFCRVYWTSDGCERKARAMALHFSTRKSRLKASAGDRLSPGLRSLPMAWRPPPGSITRSRPISSMAVKTSGLPTLRWKCSALRPRVLAEVTSRRASSGVGHRPLKPQ